MEHDNDNAIVQPGGVSLQLGDCHKVIESVATGSVSLIIFDPPYGTTAAKWDKHLDYAVLIPEFERVLTPLGTVVAFASDSFTFYLHSQFIIHGDKLRYRYSTVWVKNVGSTLAHCKNRPNKLHEDILVFSKGVMGHPGAGMGKSRRRMTYNPQGLVELVTPKMNSGKRGHSASIRQSIFLNEQEGVMCRKDGTPYSFAASTHTNYPTTLLRYDRVQGVGHQTAKNVTMLENLIRTYSNEGELVLDPTMGVASTGIACIRSGRAFAGIEQDAEYFALGKKRLETERVGGRTDIAA